MLSSLRPSVRRGTIRQPEIGRRCRMWSEIFRKLDFAKNLFPLTLSLSLSVSLSLSLSLIRRRDVLANVM